MSGRSASRTRIKVLVLLAAVGVLVAVLIRGGGPAPVEPAGPATPLVGVNVNRVFDDLVYSAAQTARLLGALAATGVAIARSDTLWEATEPAPGVFNWSFDDGVAGALAGAGLPWLPILDYAPPWARVQPGLQHSPPADPATYAAFAAAVARRYGPRGSFWTAHPALRLRPVTTYEIWNEPDIAGFWTPVPNAGAYARLYAAARAAIHGVDPGARVIVGGLTAPRSFLPAMLAADPGLRGELDGVAIHPYGAGTADVLAFVRGARRTLDSLGVESVPLYATEFGWVTAPRGPHYVPAAARPGLIRQTVAALGHTDCGLAAEILYTWVTPRRNPRDLEDWYGIEPPAGGLSADVDALAQGAAQVRAAEPRIRVCG